MAASLLAPTVLWCPHELVTIQHLEWLCISLDFFNPFDAAVFTIACLSFWSQAHLGELLFSAAFDPQLHIACDSINFGVSSSERCYGKGWLPCTKTKLHGD